MQCDPFRNLLRSRLFQLDHLEFRLNKYYIMGKYAIHYSLLCFHFVILLSPSTFYIGKSFIAEMDIVLAALMHIIIKKKADPSSSDNSKICFKI